MFEDATPEVVRDFFWDDEYRLKWDDMLIHAETLEECPTTGNMMVQWVRKVRIPSAHFLVSLYALIALISLAYVLPCFFVVQFPFFCSDREYIIGRRIWESGRSYYCVTKVWECF